MTDVFPLSLLCCFLLWFINKNFDNKFLKNLRISPQTFHKKSTSRLGGIAIYFPLIITSYFIDSSENYDFLRMAIICILPVFFVGLLDDLNIDIKPVFRLLLLLPTQFYFFLIGSLELKVWELFS